MKLDVSPESGGTDRLVGLGLGVAGHDLLKATETRHAVQKLLEKTHQSIDGLEKGGDEQKIGGKIADVDDSLEEKHTARRQHHQIQKIGEQAHTRAEDAHGEILPSPGLFDLAVGLVELGVFVVGGGIGAGYPHAGDGRFHIGIDLAHLHACLMRGVPQHPSCAESKEQHKGQHRKDDQGQQQINSRQNDKRARQHHDGKEEIFRPVVRQFRNLLQIVNHAAHQRAGFVFIEKGKGQPLQQPEHIPSHIGLHPHAHNMAPILDNEVEKRLEQIDPQQHGAPDHDKAKLTVWHIAVDDLPGDNGIDQIAAGHQKGAEHVDGKQLPMGLVIGNKFSDHRRTSFLGHSAGWRLKAGGIYLLVYTIFLRVATETRKIICFSSKKPLPAVCSDEAGRHIFC